MTAHLVVLVLLVCPYCCFGQAAGQFCAAEAAGCCSVESEINRAAELCPKCCCEEPSAALSAPPADETPVPQRQSSDCLCRGALAAAVDRVAEVDPDGDVCLFERLQRTETRLSGTASPANASTGHLAPFATGREICALVNALLL